MIEPLSFEQARGLELHAPFWQPEEVKAMMADRPHLPLYHVELPVSQRRALEWHNALYRDQTRRGEVVLCLQNSAGQFLMHSKSFYLPGIYRLLTGGIHYHEPLMAALQRETLEETGWQALSYQPLAVVFYTFCHQQARVPFISYLFFSAVAGLNPVVQDEGESISAFTWMDPVELKKASRMLLQLPTAWEDWGRMRAVAHTVLLQLAVQE
ncbi:MAG: NUDIX domain protein [bacterium ADurb.Bin478]|nr:MAG: NUDIX domain protein [bacterium ADurb.Bin478]